jgi:23S rRNA (uracil1939-C5)-methyltransferase
VSAEVTVRGIAVGGDGVGRLPDGRAVSLPRTAPGDLVRVQGESLHAHGNFARGRLAEILHPAPGRVPPQCLHYREDQCGGCQLQHLNYEVQLAVKRRIVGDCLRRIGKLEVDDPDIVPATAPWGYRAKISLAVAHDGAIGLHPLGQATRVFPLAECLITDARLMTLWRAMRAHIDLLPECLTRLTLRLDREDGLHVIAESSGEPWRAADRLRSVLTMRVTCWWQPEGGVPRVVAGQRTGFPATAFEQINPGMGETARRWSVEQLEQVAGEVVWDLYCGLGDTASLLADRGARVISVDADRRAIEWARGRSDLQACGDRVRFIAGRAVRAVRAFDLFPQTAHVETVVQMVADSPRAEP